MEINVENYLSEQQMTEIAETVYTERITARIETMIDNTSRYGSGMFDRVLEAVVAQYALQISRQYETRIIQEVEKEIARTKSINTEYDDTFSEKIRYVLQDYARKVIDESETELRPLIYDKIISACDNQLFSRIINDIFYRLNLNDTIKQVAEQLNKPINGGGINGTEHD